MDEQFLIGPSNHNCKIRLTLIHADDGGAGDSGDNNTYAIKDEVVLVLN
jgi:hypothetical protein